MKKLWPLLLLPGGVLVLALADFARLYAAATTGIESLDRFPIRGFVVAWCLIVFGPAVDDDIVKAMMSIIHQESRGDPKNYLGDTDLGPGPSVGPGNVYRSTAREQKFVPDSISFEDYKKYAAESYEWTTIGWAVKVFKVKLAAAGGDVVDGVRRYNGAGPRAETYRDQVVAFASQVFGGIGNA